MAYLDSIQKGATTYRLCDPNTAAEFSAAVAYAAGEYVNYDGTLYKFTADHAAGAWTGADATAVTAAEELAALEANKADIAALNAIGLDIEDGILVISPVTE